MDIYEEIEMFLRETALTLLEFVPESIAVALGALLIFGAAKVAGVF